MSKTITLYSTLGCHLCEQAKSLSWPVLAHHDSKLEEIDIADDDGLMEELALSIPVLEDESGRRLRWPFDQDQLDHWLAAAG